MDDLMDDEAACPSTYSDLLFWCIFFLVPSTSWLCYLLWRRSVEAGLVNQFETQGTRIKGRVVQKEAKAVREYHGSVYVDFWERKEEDFVEPPVRPFYLFVQYTPEFSKTPQTKRLEVSEWFYERKSVGDPVKLHQIPGSDRSAVILNELKKEVANYLSLIVPVLVLVLLALGLCALNACVPYGWHIVSVCLMITFSYWWILNHCHRETLVRLILDPPGGPTEQEQLLGDSSSQV